MSDDVLTPEELESRKRFDELNAEIVRIGEKMEALPRCGSATRAFYGSRYQEVKCDKYLGHRGDHSAPVPGGDTEWAR